MNSSPKKEDLPAPVQDAMARCRKAREGFWDLDDDDDSIENTDAIIVAYREIRRAEHDLASLMLETFS